MNQLQLDGLVVASRIERQRLDQGHFPVQYSVGLRLSAAEPERNDPARRLVPDDALHMLTLTVDAGGPLQLSRTLGVAFCGFDDVPCGCGVQVNGGAGLRVISSAGGRLWPWGARDNCLRAQDVVYVKNGGLVGANTPGAVAGASRSAIESLAHIPYPDVVPLSAR